MKLRNCHILTLPIVALGVLSSPLFGRPAEAATIRSTTTVNFREAGSITANRLEHLEDGVSATLLDQTGDWYQVEIQGITGFTHKAFWTLDTVTALEAASLRQGPDQLTPASLNVMPGTQAKFLGRRGEWILIEANGHTGYSHQTYWDVPVDLLPELPEADPAGQSLKGVAVETDDTAGTTLQGVPLREHQVILNEEIPGYPTAADAVTAANSIGLQAKSDYILTQIEDGMYHLTDKPDGPGFWIDPVHLVQQSGDRYELFLDLPGHMDASSAKAGKDPVVTVSSGTYFIYRIHGGMYNVSTSASAPGAWIDPALNQPEMNSAVPIGDQVVAEALELIGAPYLLGAESWEEGGFDCSGVTHFSYGQSGFKLPRRASQQWAGIDTKIREPRPGDIVAFEKDGEVYHVGLYIGNQQMIHAPKPGAFVKISDLGWWYKNSTVKGFLRPYADQP